MKRDSNTIVAGFNTPNAIMDRMSGQKINKVKANLN